MVEMYLNFPQPYRYPREPRKILGIKYVLKLLLWTVDRFLAKLNVVVNTAVDLTRT